MKRTKKMAAWALAATMMLSSSMAVFAGSDVTPSTNGSIQGTGTSEGHVEREVQNVILPTVPTGTTPFAYIMDPERLIQETDAKKYAEGTVFPEENDTGVYFLVGEKTYANTSNALQVVNKSSCDVTLTVKAKATQNTTKDISLATNATPSSTSPELYLGLKVGKSADTAISTTEQTVTKTIAGTPTNFEATVKNDAYVYQEKADATTWKAIDISMTGAVSEKAIESDTTAPTVEVTWSWAKAADTATVDTTDQVDYTATPATSSVPETVTVPNSGDVTVPVTVGSDGADLTKLETSLYAGDMLTLGNGYGATYADGIITLGADVVAFIRDASADDLAGVTFTATFGTDSDAYAVTFKFTK